MLAQLFQKKDFFKIILFSNIFIFCIYIFLNNSDTFYIETNKNLFFTNQNFIIFFNFILDNMGVSFKKFLSFILFPLAISYLLFKIFNKYLNSFWSAIFTFIGIFSNETVPFREYLTNLIYHGQNTYTKINFEAFTFPFPSISFLVFLILFYLIINEIKFTYVKIILYSICWLFLIEISFFDGLFGLIFWISFFPIKLLKKKESKSNEIYYNVLIILLLIIYIFFKFKSLQLNFNSESIVDWNYLKYHFFSYFFLPISFLILANLSIKVDIHEMYVKFSNIIILIFVHHVLILAISFFTDLNLRMFETGIQMIFTHFYYFVPSLYFLSRSIISFQGIADDRNYLFYIKKITFYSFNYILVFLAIIFYLIFNFYLISSFQT